MGGARGGGLLHGAAAAAGPHVLLQAQAELAAALAVRPAEAAVQRACRNGGGRGAVNHHPFLNSQSCIRTKATAASALLTNV